MTDEDDDDRSYREYSRLGGKISGFAAVLSGVVASAVLYGTPRMELVVLPIFKSYRIDPTSVTRSGQNLCWTREGEKLRNPPLIDIDITVDFISPITGKLGHQPTPALFFEASGDDFTTDDVQAPGPFRTRVCVRLAREIKPDQPVQVRQTVYFGSITGVWTVPFYVPTIVYPSNAIGVFAQHDHAPTPDGGEAVAGPPPEMRPRPQRYDGNGTDGMLRSLLAGQGSEPDTISGGYTSRVTTYTTPEMRARLEQYRQAHSLRSGSEAGRECFAKCLDDDDRDALGPYDPGRK